MRSIIKLSIIIFICYLTMFIKAQPASIQLNVFQDLRTIDIAAFAFDENLENLPRIMQVIINPPGKEVIVEGVVTWMKDQKSGFLEVGRFKTRPFTARTFYNDEIGSVRDIEIESSSYNSDLTNELRAIGKPKGIFRIVLTLYDKDGNRLAEDKKEEFVFLNPTPPSIISPQEGTTYDVGNILVQWTESIGAKTYKIMANYLGANETYEQALKAGNPLINDRDVGNVTSINFRDLLNRELLSDTTIVLAVKAIVPRPGGNDELISPIVTFKTSSGAKTTQEGSQQQNISPELLRLANFLNSLGKPEFSDKLLKGKIDPNQIQITDENGNIVSFTDLTNILNYLEGNEKSIISINFISK